VTFYATGEGLISQDLILRAEGWFCHPRIKLGPVGPRHQASGLIVRHLEAAAHGTAKHMLRTRVTALAAHLWAIDLVRLTRDLRFVLHDVGHIHIPKRF